MPATTPKAHVINGNTLVPLGLLVTTLGGFFAMAKWVGTVETRQDVSERDVATLSKQKYELDQAVSSRLDEHSRAVSELKSQVSGVDAKVSIVLDLVREQRAELRQALPERRAAR